MYKISLLMMMMAPLIQSGPGLRAAGLLLRKSITVPTRFSHDIILNNKINRRQMEITYKVNILRQRIGFAWEWACTDFGFVRNRWGIDLVNTQRKIAIELKNGYRINSMVKAAYKKRLKKIKREKPGYTVIFGVINAKHAQGRDEVGVDGIRVMAGNPLLTLIFGNRKNHVINMLRAAIPHIL